MVRFLLVYFGVYGGANFYVFWKLHRAFPGRIRFQIAAGVFLALTVLAPVLVRAFDLDGPLGFRRVLAYIGYLWMAVVFWFFTIGLLVEGWNLFAWLVSRIAPAVGRHTVSPRAQLIASAALIACGFVWGTIEAWNVRLVTHRVPARAFAPGTRPIRVAVISDLHLSHTVGKRRLARILDRVEEARPDVLVSHGDLSDLRLKNASPLAEMLRQAKAPMGKYGVMGNHEFYTGVENSEAYHEAAGFRLLRQESAVLDGRLRLVGVDYPGGFGRGAMPLADEDAVLPSARDDLFTVLLKHRPAVRPASMDRFDLQLSGHVHGGQIFPFQLAVRLEYAIPTGLHRYRNGAYVYVTRGSGTWGPPLRVLAPPEVVLFILEAPESHSTGSSAPALSETEE